MELTYAPKLLEGLLASVGARLQHLQLVVAADGPAGLLWDEFWRSLKACTGVAVLQLVLMLDSEQSIDRQVRSHAHQRPSSCHAQRVSLVLWQLCLLPNARPAINTGHKRCIGPILLRTGLPLPRGSPEGWASMPAQDEAHRPLSGHTDHEDENPEWHVGVPLAPQEGAQGVCNALGKLVAAGVMPALAQAASLSILDNTGVTCFLRSLLTFLHATSTQSWVCMPQVVLYPCVHDSDMKYRGGQGPSCEGAPHVKVACRCDLEWTSSRKIGGPGMRVPEAGSAVSDATRRAFRSLDLGFYGDWTDVGK